MATVSTMWTVPFDATKSAVVTVDFPPLASVRTILSPFILAFRVPPFSVVTAAVPLPSAINFARSAAFTLPATT